MTLVTFEGKFFTIYNMVVKMPSFAEIIGMNPVCLELKIDIALDSDAYRSWLSPFIKYNNVSIPKDNYYIDKILEENLHSEIVSDTETRIVLKVMTRNMKEYMKLSDKYCINPIKYDFDMD